MIMYVSEWGIPKNGWLVMEPPFKMDDLGLLPFQETSKYLYNLVRAWLCAT